MARLLSAITVFLFGITMSATAIPIRVACIGDSITQGLWEGGTNGGYSYRYWLWKAMILAGYNVDFVGSINWNHGSQITPPPVNGIPFDKDHEGHTSYRADQILLGAPGTNNNFGSNGTGTLAQWLTGYTPDVAFVMLGTNDSLASQDGNSTVVEIFSVVRALQADSPRASIFVCSLGSTTRNPGPVQIAQINAGLSASAESWSTDASPVYFVNCTAGYSPAFNYDGLHPNAVGEQFLASRMFERFQETVGPPNFESWIAGFPEIPSSLQGADDDPNRDGFTNFQHFMFGGSPFGSSSNFTPVKLLSCNADGSITFSVTRRRHTGLDTMFTGSSDLETWVPRSLRITESMKNGFYDDIIIEVAEPEGEAPKSQFWRVEVNTPES